MPNFPHLIQPYILNKIIYLKKSGFSVTILAYDKGAVTNENDTLISRYRLLEDTIYLNLDGNCRFVKELSKAILKSAIKAKKARRVIRNIKRSLLKEYGGKYFLKTLVRLAAFDHQKVNIIHSHSFFTSFDYLYLRDLFGIPMITTFHGLLPENAGKWIEHDKLSKVLEVGDVFLTNTTFARYQLESLGCRNQKILTLPQGIDTKKFQFRARDINTRDEVVLLSVARLSPEKGLDHAIKAVHKLRSSLKLRYRIVGAGPERESLVALIDRLGIKEDVELIGTMDQSKLLYEYYKADILLVPSIRGATGWEETQGVVIQEAQATGLPVIATRIGGIPECITDGKTGLLVEEKSPEEIARAVEFLASHPEKYRELSYAGRKDVEKRFDMNEVGGKLLNIYESVLEQNNAMRRSGHH